MSGRSDFDRDLAESRQRLDRLRTLVAQRELQHSDVGPIENEIAQVDRSIVAAQAALQSQRDELQKAWQVAADSQKSYSRLVEILPEPSVITSFDGTILESNQAAAKSLSLDRPVRKASLMTLVNEADRQAFIHRLAELARRGDRAYLAQWQVRFDLPERESVPMELCAGAIPVGSQYGLHWIIRDRSDREDMAHRRTVLTEGEHRMKNTMAAIMSIAERTLESSRSLDDFRRDFIARLAALSRTHALLTRENMQGVEAKPLFQAVLQPYAGDRLGRVSIEGDPVFLTSKAAQCLGMSIHELATNAAKYGALSTPRGRVSLNWRVEQRNSNRDFVIQWTETGGPPVKPPTRRGFGSEMIEECTRRDLNGTATMTYDPAGLRCDIRVPLSRRVGYPVTGEPARPAEPAFEMPSVEVGALEHEEDSGEQPQPLAGRRVLIVEDTHLVAVEQEHMLEEFRCNVVGIAATLEEAREALAKHEVDIVLLDLNLDGESSWSIAEELRSRGIPFILTTGYSCPASLPEQFKNCAYLEKPFERSTLARKLMQVLDVRQGASQA